MPPPSSHQRAMEVFDRVCDLPADARMPTVARLCGDDDELRRMVEAMLRHDVEPMEELQDSSKGGLVDLLIADIAGEHGRPAPGLEPQPAQIGSYRILRKLGEGGMGVVYLAEQQRPQRVVALKVIRGGVGLSSSPSTSATPSALRRFEREAHVLGLLAHPNIAQIFEAGAAAPSMPDGSQGRSAQPFLAMEFVDGAPITRHAAERRLDARQRLELVMQACLAVEYAHRRGVIHRDLKPSNILVAEPATRPISSHPSSRGGGGAPSALSGATVKILDFGIARLVDPDAHLTTIQTDVGQLIGTLQYMSPEQVSADPAALDTRSDVYALGVVMYELLTGKLPHDLHGRPVHEAARIIRDEAPQRMSALDRSLRGDIETIVGKALEKEPQRRYQGAAELAADIGRFLGDEPIVARPATAIEHLRKFVRRNRALSAAMSALLVALIAGSVASSLLAIRAIAARNDAMKSASLAEENARTADREAERARRKAYLANIAVARGALAANEIVEARRWLDAVEAAQRRNWEWRFIDARLDKSVAVLLAPGSAVYCVDESPDGALLASAAWDGGVRLWDRASRELLAVLEPHDDPSRPNRPTYWVEFSPGGDRLVSGSTDHTVRVWDVATRRELFACRDHENIVHCARYSPDGSLIASCSEDGTVRLWDGATGAALPKLTKHVPRQQLRSVAFSPDGTRIAVACSGGATLVYETSGNRPIATLFSRGGIVYSVEFSPDGSRLATAAQDGTIRLLGTDDWQPRVVIDLEGRQIRHVSFSPDGAKLAVALGDMTVRLHDANDGRAIGVLTGHIGNVTHVVWSADGARLASTSSDADGSIRLWDPSFAKDYEELSGHQSGVFSIAYSPDGDTMTSVGTNREVRRWDAASGAPLSVMRPLTPRAQGDRTAAHRLSPDGRWLLSAAGDRTVTRTDVLASETFEPIAVPGAANITALATTLDGRWLVAGDVDGGAFLLAAPDGELVGRATSAGGAVRSVAISADGMFAGIGDERGGVVLWSLPDGPVVTAHEGDDRAASGMQFSADGSLLACAGYGENARVFNGRTGELLWTFDGHPGGARSVAISPDGRRIATGSGTGAVRLWDATTGEEIMTLRVGSLPVLALAFSRDGDTLAIGSTDGMIRLCRTVPVAEVAAARRAPVE